MSSSFDVGIIGLGAHGTAIAHHAARRGLSVLGLERFDIPHDQGSSHGTHRLFRLAYAEGPHYVPLLARAAQLWEEIEQLSGERLFVRNGVLIAAPGGDAGLRQAAASARAHDIGFELLEGRDINRRFPAFRLPADYVGLLQPQSGFVLSERAILSHALSAQQDGARLVTRTQVMGWEVTGNGDIEIRTLEGRWRCRQLVVAAGAWTARLLPQLQPLHEVGRRVIGYFQPRRPQDFVAARCPGFSFSSPTVGIYGFPIFGAPGVKIGRDGHLGETGDPDGLSRDITTRDEQALREGLDAFLNDVDGPALALKSCMVTKTPDEHFIIDRLPGAPAVHVVSACSGHGFKLASVIGEIVADRLQGRADRFDLGAFRLSRFHRRQET